MERQYKYIGFFFLIFVVFVGLGFYYPYFSLFPHFKSVSAIVHIHAIALLLWVVILITQTLLITYNKIKRHRFIGKITYFLMPIIIISSIGVLWQQYYEGIEQKMTSIESLKTIFTFTTELISIIIFYTLAVRNILKGNVAFHMRYMICVALVFIPPSFGRTLGYWLYLKQYYTYNISILLCILILFVLIIYDRREKLKHRPYVVGLLVFLLFHISWYILGHPI